MAIWNAVAISTNRPQASTSVRAGMYVTRGIEPPNSREPENVVKSDSHIFAPSNPPFTIAKSFRPYDVFDQVRIRSPVEMIPVRQTSASCQPLPPPRAQTRANGR